MEEKADIAYYKGQIRKELSLKAVRSQARVLLARLSDLGPGAAAAAKRGWAEQEEWRRVKARRDYQLCMAQGRPGRSCGQFFTD